MRYLPGVTPRTSWRGYWCSASFAPTASRLGRIRMVVACNSARSYCGRRRTSDSDCLHSRVDRMACVLPTSLPILWPEKMVTRIYSWIWPLTAGSRFMECFAIEFTAQDNNVLIRSGEALGVGWSRNMLYSGFITLTRSVIWSADFNGRSDNTDVMPLQIFANDFSGNSRLPSR